MSDTERSFEVTGRPLADLPPHVAAWAERKRPEGFALIGAAHLDASDKYSSDLWRFRYRRGLEEAGAEDWILRAPTWMPQPSDPWDLTISDPATRPDYIKGRRR